LTSHRAFRSEKEVQRSTNENKRENKEIKRTATKLQQQLETKHKWTGYKQRKVKDQLKKGHTSSEVDGNNDRKRVLGNMNTGTVGCSHL